MLIEDIIALLTWLILSVVTLIGGFVLITIQRRVTRRRYFDRLDQSRQKVRNLLEPLYEQPTDAEAAVASLRSLRSREDLRALEEALLRHAAVSEHFAFTQEIARRLGWIDEWISLLRFRVRRLSGPVAKMLADLGDDYRPPRWWKWPWFLGKANFVKRCRAADKLGQLPTPQGMWALLAGATDPHPEVQEICLRYLGQLADPATLPVLVEELVKVLEGRSSQSVRNIKTALVQYSLLDVGAFLGPLQHPNRRVRFFVTDIIREIAERHASSTVLSKNDFPPEIYRLFTERFHGDEWPDVRARAATVVSHFHDDASLAILRKLLEDEVWFVRMHAARACGSKLYLPLATEVVQRLTDTNWLVREAATRALAQMGENGLQFIIEAFVGSQDRYSAEQICEELQRSGLLLTLMDGIPDFVSDTVPTGSGRVDGRAITTGEEKRRLAELVVRKMAATGKITMLLLFLRSPMRPVVKQLILAELGVCFTPDCLATFQDCAEREPDPQVRVAAVGALRTALERAEAAALEAEASRS